MKHAREFHGNIGYRNSFLKILKILFFSKASPVLKLDDGIQAFYLSMID